jgi:benzoate/toluate 1,2-dioxygenase beta subunit
VTSTVNMAAALGPVPDGFDRCDVEQFLYREARYADESDYDAWEALWTDDGLYWVPAGGPDIDPGRQMSIIFDNRNRISTRLKQLPNIELLGGRANPEGGVDLEVAANFLVLESRARGNHLWGGRTTYRLRLQNGALLLAYKKVVLVDNDRPIPTMGFLI